MPIIVNPSGRIEQVPAELWAELQLKDGFRRATAEERDMYKTYLRSTMEDSLAANTDPVEKRTFPSTRVAAPVLDDDDDFDFDDDELLTPSTTDKPVSKSEERRIATQTAAKAAADELDAEIDDEDLDDEPEADNEQGEGTAAPQVQEYRTPKRSPRTK